MNRLTMWEHVLALAAAGVIGVGALIAVVVPWKASFSRRKRSKSYSVTMLTLLLAACAVVSADAATFPAPAPRARAAVGEQRASIAIDVPEPPLPGNPVPLVTCQTSMQGTGSLPDGDVLAIGYQGTGSQTSYYQPSVTWDGDKWSAVIYFGGRQDAGKVFRVTAVVMPAAMETYLLAVFKSAQPSATWWAAPGPLPAPAYVAAGETVQRTHSQAGCTF